MVDVLGLSLGRSGSTRRRSSRRMQWQLWHVEAAAAPAPPGLRVVLGGVRLLLLLPRRHRDVHRRAGRARAAPGRAPRRPRSRSYEQTTPPPTSVRRLRLRFVPSPRLRSAHDKLTTKRSSG